MAPRAASERWSETGYNDHTAVKVDGGSYEAVAGHFRAAEAREEYRRMMSGLQRLVGDTVIIDFSFTGFCDVFDAMGPGDLHVLSIEYPDLLEEYLEAALANELARVHAVADPGSPRSC